MSYTIKQDGETWQVLSNGVPLLAGLSKEEAIAKGREFSKAAILAEAEEESEDDA